MFFFEEENRKHIGKENQAPFREKEQPASSQPILSQIIAPTQNLIKNCW